MNIFKGLLDIFFPPNFTCDICGKEIFSGDNLCDGCRGTVTLNNKFTCPVCGRKTLTLQLCLECKANPPLFDMAASPLVYSEGVQKLILKFKKGQPYLKEYFGRLMKAKCAVFADAEAICYVPMTRSTERNRGYNQAYLLAKELSKQLNIPLIKNAVAKVKKSPSQKSLTRKERTENLKSCFKADKSVVGGKIFILVDDVLTTGATADAVCGELKKRGAKKVYLITAASVEYKGEV